MHFTGQGQGEGLIHFPGSSIKRSWGTTELAAGQPEAVRLQFSLQECWEGLGLPFIKELLFHGQICFPESNNVIFPDGRGSQEVIDMYETQGAYPR